LHAHRHTRPLQSPHPSTRTTSLNHPATPTLSHPSPCSRSLIQLLASAFVTSWSGVVRIHGIRPTPRPGQPAGVFVANHSSMIDFILLLQSHPYAVVGQHHAGWVRFFQDSILGSLHCLWFNRGENKDRKIVADRISAHSHDPSRNHTPLLVFPEGTCVNNEYVVQFKKFVFELGVPINPIAIKYNKVRGRWAVSATGQQGRAGTACCSAPLRVCARAFTNLYVLPLLLPPALLPAPCRCSWTPTGTAASSPSCSTSSAS